MGLMSLEIEVANLHTPERSEVVRFQVSAGVSYSVVSADVLERLQIRPLTEQRFRLPNGEETTRRLGAARFRFAERTGATRVVFGEAGDSNSVGSLALAPLGFELDPATGELVELPMLL
jgi:predicted aspartyl protease